MHYNNNSLDFTLIFGRLGLMEYICMWTFEVYKFEKIYIWHVLSKKKLACSFSKKKKKKGRLFGIIVEFEKTKDCWKEMIKAKKRPLESKSLLDKK